MKRAKLFLKKGHVSVKSLEAPITAENTEVQIEVGQLLINKRLRLRILASVDQYLEKHITILEPITRIVFNDKQTDGNWVVKEVVLEPQDFDGEFIYVSVSDIGLL